MQTIAKQKKRLGWYFKTLKITPAILNNTTGIAKRTCFDIVNGNTFPSVENLTKIITAFPQISLKYILTGG